MNWMIIMKLQKRRYYKIKNCSNLTNKVVKKKIQKAFDIAIRDDCTKVLLNVYHWETNITINQNSRPQSPSVPIYFCIE